MKQLLAFYSISKLAAYNFDSCHWNHKAVFQ